VNLKKGGNIIELGKEIDQKLDELRTQYPWGVKIERIASQDLVVSESVNNFIINLLQAVGVVLFVMLLFLGFRTGMVVASLIPTTIVMSLLIMSIMGLGLNTVTLASLIIALGMLVDNAIVISESIMDKMQRGQGARKAAISSARELRIPLLTSSLTTSAAFMAFYLADSVRGEIMGNIFLVVTIALMSSWVLSLTMIPLFCTYAIKVEKTDLKQAKPTLFDKSRNIYKKFLLLNLRHPAILIAAIVVTFAGSLMLFKYIPFIFMPKSERALVTANIELPLGTQIEKTTEVVDGIEQFILKNLKVNESRTEGIVSWSTFTGEGAPKYDLGYNPPESSPNAAHILLNTSSDEANDLVITELDNFIFKTYPDVTRRVSRLLMGGGSVNPVEIRVSGKDPKQLSAIKDKIKAKLKMIPGSKNIDDNWGLRMKKILVNIRPDEAQLAGLTNQDIAISLQTMLSGAVTGNFRDGDNVIPIIMQNDNTHNLSIDDLESINIYAQQSGKSVPLKQVADIEVKWQTAKILRRDLYKTISITSDVQPGYTASKISEEIGDWLKKEKTSWNNGYTYVLGGDTEGSSDAMNAVAVKLPMCMFIIVLLLIGQFNSLRKPGIILLTIPLGLIGVVLGLLFTGSYLGFMAFLGIISLAGVVINNAIVLLDRIKIEIDEMGLAPGEAIVEAALQRFRPIMLTTATTALGLVPLWMGGGAMWEPMAITIIFGLLFATVLTLVFVPVLYKVFFRVESLDLTTNRS
ncbi:efflux RND transporter permease subunit, partial [bacterium]|nr:efflux RND transporter permease subunit [bacterium]